MAKLPDLPYDYDALEPHIDKETMTIHHTKHHQGYTNKYNAAVEGTALADKDVDDVLKDLDKVPDNIKTAVRNNGGGFSNHSLFWKNMCPASESGEPSEALLSAINDSFGSLDAFKEEFSKAAGSRFGSGWAWLVVDNGKLAVTSTANQDTPISQGLNPILGLDVWEHSYYKKFGPDRPRYIQTWWNVVNWAEVSKRFEN